MIPAASTQLDLLGIWERGEGQPAWRRALAILPDAGPMPVGRRDARLLELREQFFGRTFGGVTACPACSEDIELTFDADEVRRDCDGPSESFAILSGGYELELRLPETADLESIAHAATLADARATLFARCVIRATHDGASVDASALPEEVIDAAAAAMAARDPQADVTLEMTCPGCAHAWLEPFDVTTFLWTEVAAAARRLLREVHQLAWAYGWSEREILALSPARRSAYLEMLG